MSKLKAALLSLRASGTIKKLLSFDNRSGQRRVRTKPTPVDPKSLAQLSWRHMYQKATALWHALSSAEQFVWETDARPKHMTGFAYFMSQCLRPNPGLYLPLQGGTMQGDIDMDGFRIEDLPAPVAVTEPTRLTEMNAHIADLDAHTRNPLEIIKTGEHFDGFPFAGYRSPLALVANHLYAIPLTIPRKLTVDRIGFFCVDHVPGKFIRLGVYENGTDLYPGALIEDFGLLSVNTGYTAFVLTISPARQFDKGLYWIALLTDATPSLYGRMYMISPLGIKLTNYASCNSLWDVAQAYGALPNPFTAGGAVGCVSGNDGKMWMVPLRLLSLD